MKHISLRKIAILLMITIFLFPILNVALFIAPTGEQVPHHDIELKTSIDSDGDGFENETEVSLGTDPLDRWDYPKPDLNISEVQSSVPNIIVVSVSNVGIWNTTNVILIVEIYSLSLELYNNSELPIFLEVNDEIDIVVDLTDFAPYLVSGMSYQVDINIDPNDVVNETNELNNQMILYGVQYRPSSIPPEDTMTIIIVSMVIIIATASSIGGVYVIKKRQLWIFGKKKEKIPILEGNSSQIIDRSQLSEIPRDPSRGRVEGQAKIDHKKKSIKEASLDDKAIAMPEMTEEEKKAIEATESEMGIERNAFKCIVHRGEVVGTVYICPDCQTVYCQNCARILKRKGEKCWSCKKELNVE